MIDIARAAAPDRDVLDAAIESCRRELLDTSVSLAREGMPGTEAEGQLLRPLIARAGAGFREGQAEPLPSGFWFAALAIQLAHEASLVHDDIIDDSPQRRAGPSFVASRGVARAVVHGDHLLTAGYWAAAATGSLDFVRLFTRAVERTVAWESEQGRVVGEVLGWSRYEKIALGKSGELMGCSLAAAAALAGSENADELFELGRRIGLLYQMLDDLLDYCPSAETGKPPLRDYEQRRWTWPLLDAPTLATDLSREGVLSAMHTPMDGGSPMMRSLGRFEDEADCVRWTIWQSLPGDRILQALIGDWVSRARAAVEKEAGRRGRFERMQPIGGDISTEVLAGRVPAADEVYAYLGRHSRSFRFACRFFSGDDAERIARVYAYCRVTDDLVDRPPDGISPAQLVDEWEALSRRAYAGEGTPIPLLNTVMSEMAAARTPFDYAAELCEGMRMDLRGDRYETMAELRRYTYRVASVVGLWVTRLFDVHEPQVLDRASRMGHAMQLTNILRDVGEDWRGGRLYLPLEVLERHGISGKELEAICSGGGITSAYRAAVEEMLLAAESDYDEAFVALPALPASLGRSAAVAAYAYRGIHREIRRLDYDNIGRRAYTQPLRKGWLAVRSLAALSFAPPFPELRKAADPIMTGVAAKL